MKKILLSIGFILLILLVYILGVRGSKNSFSLQNLLNNPTPTPVLFEGKRLSPLPITPIDPLINASTSAQTPDEENTQNLVIHTLQTIPTDNEGEKIITTNDDYTIFYTVQTGSFSLMINASPFSDKRALAETAFLNRLQLTKQQACQLSVNISTLASVNPDFSEEVYPLSFCTGTPD